MVAAAKCHQVNGCGHMTSLAQAHGASLPYAYMAIARNIEATLYCYCLTKLYPKPRGHGGALSTLYSEDYFQAVLVCSRVKTFSKL